MKNIVKFGLLGLAAAAIAGGAYYYASLQSEGLEGIAYSNGRIEAETIDIATRVGGRILSVPVEEGQIIQAGDVVAELELNDVAASLAGAEATVRARRQQRDEAQSVIAQAESALTLASKEFERVDALVKSGAVSRSQRDQRLNEKRQAEAALTAAQQRLSAAVETIDAAQAEADRLKDILKDQKLYASKAGRVLYKLVEPGEVVAAGGRIVTLVDLSDVYMSVFLPTADIGRLRLRDEARIILDAIPDTPIPAYISYISPEAQFTPRQVETRTEREKLTFRVKIKIPAELLNRHLDAVKTGLPGMAYVRADNTKDWPPSLQVDPRLLASVQDDAASTPEDVMESSEP